MKNKANVSRAEWIPLIVAIEWWRHISLRAGGGGFSRPKKLSRIERLRRFLVGA
jgi:hypothetical protein